MVYVGMIQISWVLLLPLVPAAAGVAAVACCCHGPASACCSWVLLSLLVAAAADVAAVAWCCHGPAGACCCWYGCNKTHSLVSSKDTTPLAESLAGAIVCAVIASGSSMKEALDATKVLAEDCRLRGTAFRLGAVLRELVKFLPDDVHTRSNGRVREGENLNAFNCT